MKWTARHNDRCEVCDEGGELLCCDFCNLAFHLRCLEPPLTATPAGDWACEECAADNARGGSEAKLVRAPPSTHCDGSEEEGGEGDGEMEAAAASARGGGGDAGGNRRL